MTFFSPYAEQLRNSAPEQVRHELAFTESRLCELREEGPGGREGEIIRRMWENRRAVTCAVLEEKRTPARIMGRLEVDTASGLILRGPCAGHTLAYALASQTARLRPGEVFRAVYGRTVRRWTFRGRREVQFVKVEAVQRG